MSFYIHTDTGTCIERVHARISVHVHKPSCSSISGGGDDNNNNDGGGDYGGSDAHTLSAISMPRCAASSLSNTCKLQHPDGFVLVFGSCKLMCVLKRNVHNFVWLCCRSLRASIVLLACMCVCVQLFFPLFASFAPTALKWLIITHWRKHPTWILLS